MASNKKYWKSVEELNENSSIVDTLRQNEFVEEIPTDDFLGDKETLEKSSTTRRDFLKYVGFSTAAASLASCEGPVRKAIPYVVKPNEITPGIADYYASTIADGYDFASVLVKVREGRPIKLEPNKDAKGSTNARVQASVLSLYDSLRLQAPSKEGSLISWDTADSEIGKALTSVAAANKTIAILSSTDANPMTNKLIAEFTEKYGNVRHVIYDAVSESAAIDAFEAMYGKRVLPTYDFSKAKAIVSVGADFLGDWQGGNFVNDYAKGRIPNHGKMSHHTQFESNMSLTGANADVRVMVKPSAQNTILADLYNALVNGASAKDANVAKAVKQIRKAGGNAVVVTGIQDKNAQLLAMAINNAIGSEVMNTSVTNNTRQGNDTEVAQLVADMKAGRIGAILINNSNPVYTLPNSADFVEGLGKVDLSVAFSMVNNETVQATQYALPTPHNLESWGVVEMKSGQFSLMQPTIRPLFDTRQFQDCLLKWTGNVEKYYDYIKTEVSALRADKSFNKALQDGYFSASSSQEVTAGEVDLSAAYRSVANTKGSGLELQLYTKVGLGDGQQANNPWLQELPDPITRTTWDNYLTVSQADAERLGIENKYVANGALNGSLVELSANGVKVTIPALIQPGQAPGSVGLALGYGRKAGLKPEMQVGKNAYHFYKNFNTFQSDVKISPIAGTHKFACTQLHNTMMGRGDIVKETTLATYNDHSLDPKHTWNPVAQVSYKHQEVEATTVDLWDEFDRSVGHHFNLSIDLNACTGCGACVVACHAENNVPVVGKAEVRKSRDMHWLRIDRYYTSDMTEEKAHEEKIGAVKTFREMEKASANPQVAFQPIMCQHCNHAPCETVCPVAATSHGRQGQNQMAYNRCVGTRYCANNCPYKVRRFNWFDYANNKEFDFNMNNDLGKMVLNPDVTVRSRGVMEKCSMCIQMSQATILKAKREGRPVGDDEFQTACSNACGTGAMIFGDVNNKNSKVAKLREDKRAYHLLEHIGTRPNVVYQVKVRNTEV